MKQPDAEFLQRIAEMTPGQRQRLLDRLDLWAKGAGDGPSAQQRLELSIARKRAQAGADPGR